MRIFHIWNTAGVASVIAKFTDREFGTKSDVVTRKAADPMGLTTYGRTVGDGPSLFFLRCLLIGGGYDVVHVHSLDRIVPWLKRIRPSRPVVLHYHGTDILNRWEEKKGRWQRADYIAYSTPNLAAGSPEGAVHFPNPVDTDLFHPSATGREAGTALTIRYGMDEEAHEKAAEMSLRLTLVDRGSVPHREMPPLLSKFEYFIDFRRPKGYSAPVESLGKTALEALACGCRVVDWSGRIVEGLPEDHRPEVVARKWRDVYAELTKNES